jgi:adenosylmethionine-8-amino-7-oxononanoate aminotransferase
VFRHGYTYSGHATCCAVGLANLDLIEREKLVQRSNELEPVLKSELQRLSTAVAELLGRLHHERCALMAQHAFERQCSHIEPRVSGCA